MDELGKIWSGARTTVRERSELDGNAGVSFGGRWLEEGSFTSRKVSFVKHTGGVGDAQQRVVHTAMFHPLRPEFCAAAAMSEASRHDPDEPSSSVCSHELPHRVRERSNLIAGGVATSWSSSRALRSTIRFQGGLIPLSIRDVGGYSHRANSSRLRLSGLRGMSHELAQKCFVENCRCGAVLSHLWV